MIVNFDSKNSFYKSPFGAVKENTSVMFSVTAADGVYIDSVRIVILKNDFVHTEHYLSYVGFFDGMHKYSANLSFKETGIYRYYFIINSEQGIKTGECENGRLVLKDYNAADTYRITQSNFSMWQLTVYGEDFKTPDWAKGGIMYQIFPDRFKRSKKYSIPEVKSERKLHKKWDEIPEYIYDVPKYTANDFYGGNFDGIIEQLDYIKSLGVNIIYLNPIFESGANHRYSTADYKNADPYLGTNEDFSRLVKEAKKRDIKIILDGVFSHTGDDSIYFNKFGHYPEKGAYQGKDSPYYTWYTFGKNHDEYECWWGFKNLPNVNETDPSYMSFITDLENGVLKFWNDMGISGWRLDVADELPDAFIDALRKTVKKLNQDSLIIGEVWEDATTKESYGIKRRYLLGNQLDSVMNYPFRNAILDFACGGKGTDFSQSVMSIVENYPPQSLDVLMNSISTHDTLRAITALNQKNVLLKNQGSYKMTAEEYEKSKKRLLMSVFLQFTLPGIPCIYYGDEVGLQGYRDPYNRMTYPYGKEDFSILDFHKSLAEIRLKYKNSFTGVMNVLYADQNAVCYRRGNLIFAACNGDAAFIKAQNIGERIFGASDSVYNKYGIIMPPYSWAIFKADDIDNNRKD